MSHHTANTLAGVCAVGGIMGYVKAKSLPSLIAGLTFASLYAYSGYLIQSNADYGVELATATSVVLLGAMGPKALRTRKPVPLIMSAIGTLGTSYYGLKVYQNYNGV
ncbi:transmembrane proteins 14C-domain-containing protein [Chytridium lagenaria]|nr:transmembrane proteins 14C-domain-containing protein [Chytridium lagenaria]